ncbi:hypothetical protein LCGC14_2909120, partial [marine sediment metagenome]
VKHLDLGRLALAGSLFFGPLAISYAAQHPEQVSHLILNNSFARASDLMGTPQAQGLLALMDKDWELFTETYARVGLGWSAGEPAQRFAALMRESITPEYLQAFVTEYAKVDVTDLLPRVRCPTLVLYRRQMQGYSSDVAKGLASRIPDARLVPLEGGSPLASPDDLETLATTIDEFLDEVGGGHAEVADLVVKENLSPYRVGLVADRIPATRGGKPVQDGGSGEELARFQVAESVLPHCSRVGVFELRAEHAARGG